MSSHYFTSDADDGRRRPLDVTLAGRSLRVATAAGVFSPTALDKGTAILLAEVPDPTGEHMLDLGCGWGPVAMTMALRNPDGTVTAVDVNELSLTLTAENAARHDLPVRPSLPDDVDPSLRFDTIWSNPPIRIGKQALHEMLLRWLPRLTPQGQAWLVVQKNLGADSLQSWLEQALSQATDAPWEVTREATSKGFRVLRAARVPR